MSTLESHYKKANKIDCGGKKSFTSRRLAGEFNNRMRRRGSVIRAKGKKIEKRLHVYQCKNCGQFHIGHGVRKPIRRLKYQ